MADSAQNMNLPSTENIESAAKTDIYDSKGNKVHFGDLFASSKTIVVFIRHFFCGMCQGYVTQLAKIPESTLSEANVKLVVVGCGEWQMIEMYKKTTAFHSDIFADPTRGLYKKLGMTIEALAGTPSGQPKRSYVTGALSGALKSIWRALLHPLYLGKQGNISQLGGDFIFGPGNTCHLAHVMQHTEDHMEVADLMAAAGVQM